jgi:hypothetical protein
MDEIDDALAAAWNRVKPLIADKPDELRKRLHRHRQPALQRTPRARCLAVRANDLRIDGTHVPPGGDAWRHEVLLDAPEIGRLCAPVEIDAPGESLQEVAAKLGVSSKGLVQARLRGVFDVHHLAGLGGYWGHPVPILYTDKPLDPNARLFGVADPIWGWLARDLYRRIPDDFEQTIVRVPSYLPIAWRCAEDVLDLGDNRMPPRPQRNLPSRRLPPPEPDPVAYKWKGEQFIGYDWRAAEKNPRIRENYQRHQRALAWRRAWQKEYRRRKPPPSRSSGSLHFRGWRWLCPACQRPCKVLYYPLPPVSKLHCDLTYFAHDLPRWFVDEALASLEADRSAPRHFACERCNRVSGLGAVCHGAWNDFVAYLTRGLLYGNEVERPAAAAPRRQRVFTPRKALLSLTSQRRKDAVLERMLQGWTYKRIAADLQITLGSANRYGTRLCAEHGVRTRRALAAKLGVPPEQLLTKRDRIYAALAAGKRICQIVRETGFAKGTVCNYACRFRQGPLSGRVTASASVT